MISYRMVAVAGILANVGALPLNINLGAYSPALVVGDGEISFGGGSDVTELMNTLEGAAVNAAAGNSQARETENIAAAGSDNGINIAAADNAASEGAEDAPGVTVDPNLAEQAAQISALQGIAKAKEIAPRDPMVTEAPEVKRDLAGFDRALQYAEAALTKGPVIQLGTGEGGSGVGIIVDNTGGQIGEGAAEGAGEAGAAEKRDEVSQPQRRSKVTTMYIRRGVPEDLFRRLRARDVESAPLVNLPSIKRDAGDTIDAINLNVEGEQGVTMTVVESADEED